MPPFLHLTEPEIRSLLAYLRQLAEVPAAEKDRFGLQESSLRVGEHIVKSTCHICHDAVGPNPTPGQLLEGAIPPLSTLPSRVSLSEFVRKVTRGAPTVMGSPPLACRGRKPVFYYLSQDEAAAAYLYPTQYSPYEWLAPDENSKVLPPYYQGDNFPDSSPAATNSDRAQTTSAAWPASHNSPPAQLMHDADTEIMALRSVVGLLVFLLIAGGLGFTFNEFRRLSLMTAKRTGMTTRETHARAMPGTPSSGETLPERSKIAS